MPLSDAELTAIRNAWTGDDLALAFQTYQRAHPPASGGVVADLAVVRRVEQHLLRILARRLPAQLAATPLVHALDQALADDLADFYGRDEIADWTATFPPVPAAKNFRLGDILESLTDDYLPALLVSASMPGGANVEQGGLGPLSRETVTAHVYYVLPYSIDTEQHIAALAGAGAVANILRTVREVAGVWQNGQVTQVDRNTPVIGGGNRFIVGLVPYTCTAFLPYAPTRQ